VLDDRGERHLERPSELADRGRSADEALDHDTPRRVGERLEGEIERRRLVKHLLKYLAGSRTCQVTAEGLRTRARGRTGPLSLRPAAPGRLFFRAGPREHAASVNDLRDRLSHVLWIGGGPCVGKTTLSRMLAGTYDLKVYNLDWHHVREHRFRPGGMPSGWEELSMDDRWVRPAPQALAERELASWTARFPLVVDDLLALPLDRTVVAEGPSAFPWCVAEVIRSPRQAIFLLPTPDFREAVLSRRHRDGPGLSSAARTSDPERAARNMKERDALMAARIAVSCGELGLRYELVDGSRDLADSVALLEEHFRPHLPTTFNV